MQRNFFAHHASKRCATATTTYKKGKKAKEILASYCVRSYCKNVCIRESGERESTGHLIGGKPSKKRICSKALQLHP